MKVLLNLHSLNPGGQEVQFVLLAKHLKMMNVDVGIMISQPGGALEKDCEKFAIKLIYARRIHKYDIYGYLSRFVRGVSDFKPDVIYGGGLIPTLLKPFHAYTPVVWAIRSSGSGIASKKWLSLAHEYLGSKLIFMGDAVIANSLAGCLRAQSLSLRKAQVSVVRNGIDTEKYYLADSKRTDAKRQYHLSEDSIIIGTASRIIPVKDYFGLLLAISYVHKIQPKIKLICVGSGSADYVDELKIFAEKLGLSEVVLWIGHSDNLPEVYSCIDIFVSSSISEGFPNVIGEAMSCGLPVVATDVGDCREIIGDCGWVVPPKNPEALAAAIDLAIAALPNWSAERSRKRIEEHYSVDAMVDKTVEVFNSVVKS